MVEGSIMGSGSVKHWLKLVRLQAGAATAITAVFGAIFSFFFGYIVGYVMGYDIIVSVAIGNIFVATSVGITVRALMEIK